MERITKVKLPETGEYHTYFVFTDIHSLKYNPLIWEYMLEVSKSIPRDKLRFMSLGDSFELEKLMGKDPDRKCWAKCIFTIKDNLIPEMESEIEWHNKRLDELQERSDFVYWINGNHCDRARQWLRFCPVEYAHNFDIKKQLNLEDRGIPLIEYNDYLLIGDAIFTHGSKHGKNHNKQMFDLIGNVAKAVFYGHVHHWNQTSYPTIGRPGRAISLPCMSDLAPEYQKKRGENNWSEGFMEFTIKPNGHFNYYMYEVWDNELILPGGKILKG